MEDKIVVNIIRARQLQERVTKKQLADQYLDRNDSKIRCAAIDRDAEDFVFNAFIAGYEAALEQLKLKPL